MANVGANQLLDVPAGFGGAELKAYWSLKLLDRMVPELVHARHGVQEDVPPHRGKTIEKRRYETIPAQTTPLVEGTPGNLVTATATPVVVTVSQYGAYMLVSDVFEEQSLDGIDDIVKAFGENAGNSLDRVIRDQIVGGTTVNYASTATSRASLSSGMRLSGLEFRKAVRVLELNNAKRFAEDDTFHAIVHPDAKQDLLGDPSIVNIMTTALPRSESNPLFFGRVPQIYGVSVFETTNAKIYSAAGLSSADVYATLVFGEGAYLVTKFSADSVRTIIKEKGSSGIADPLDQVGSIGWKASCGAGILNQNVIVRIEHTASMSASGMG